MLDDQSYIARFDTQNALGVVGSQFEQLLYSFEVPVKTDVKITKVVVAGMGGSALAATFIETWPKLSVPFQIVRDYQLPTWVDETTLVIASSYSGNTEETLSALKEGKSKNAALAVISAGGALSEIAETDGLPFVRLPARLQPRMAPFYNFKALLVLLEAFGLVSGAVSELEATAKKMHGVSAAWAPSVPTAENQAKQLAEHCAGKTPIMYAGPILYPAAYKWKINFNENAKNTAWCNQLPEFNHNEFLGWSSHPVEKPFAVLDLRSSFDHPQIQRRFEVSDKLLSGKRPKAVEVQAEGETVLEQLLWTVALGDMTSLYLALLNGLNPTPVDLIEKLKQELN